MLVGLSLVHLSFMDLKSWQIREPVPFHLLMKISVDSSTVLMETPVDSATVRQIC